GRLTHRGERPGQRARLDRRITHVRTVPFGPAASAAEPCVLTLGHEHRSAPHTVAAISRRTALPVQGGQGGRRGHGSRVGARAERSARGGCPGQGPLPGGEMRGGVVGASDGPHAGKGSPGGEGHAAPPARRPPPPPAPPPPPSATPRLCAHTSSRKPAESQNRVPVMSTTTVVCPRVCHSRRIARSWPTVVASISGGAVTTGTPPTIWKGYLVADIDAHLPAGTLAASGKPGACTR